MAAARAAKRAKIERAAAPQRGEDDYVPGNIVEIELCNFMIYDRLICRPGSRLNLVVGPNGSGKSSLVCAIALGLAGDPKILGRASNVGAFVKRGEVSGHVKITLRGDTPDDKICITRKIDNENKSEWLLNGATVPKKEVIDVIKKFNIQVNNLTQFLPQDRVSEFAKLTPIQLLEETEKAVGDPNLPVQHHNLVNRSKELKALEVALKQKDQTLNNLKALNAEQEKDVERVRLRDKLLKKAELMKKKLPWLKYDMLKKEFVEVILEQEKTAKKKMEEAAKILEDSKQPIEVLKKGKAGYLSNLKKITNQMNQNMSNCRNAIDEEQQLSAELKSTFDDIEELKKQEKSRQQRILKAKEDVAAAKRELEDLQPYELPRDEMAELTDKIARVCLDINHLNDEKISIESKLDREKESMKMCSKRLKDMESKNNRLLETLRGGCAKIIDAYNWVQDNKANFQREVYGPVLLESFITLDASDRDVLVRQMKHYDIPILNYTGERGMRREPLNITPEMRQIGINSRLDQVFEAPAAVKDVLISQAGLDSSYIGTDETHRRADAVPKLGISDFWTPDNHYRWSRSRYGGHISASVEAVNPPRYFKFDLDVSGIESLRVQKEKHMKRKLEDIYKEEDVESIKRKLDQVPVLNDRRFRAVIKLKNLLVEAVALKWSYTEKNMASIEFDAKILEMEKGVKKLEKDALIAAREYEDRKRITQEHKKQLSNAKQHAESIAMITQDLAKEFLEMPSTIEELEAAIQDTESEANSMLFLNQNVLLEYQNRQREIESISIKLQDDKEEYERCCSDIETVKGKWLPTLRNLVSKINDTFSHNFQEMAVAGEVSLGMDPINERKMFQQLVRAASQLNTPQCFLLTPKLLPDLEYSDACSILNIMNGPWIEQPSKAWSAGDCWRTVMSVGGHS
ncbi:hypothetical protein PR202_ga14582 [Eleusine coracana subsp. coracana]|uniref:Structural maintenance of chromosomes protein 5 n=1 Tax=Eleusine coracana subsp. coracana TaxID=191504 RepID=A0AAV5CGV7_ELECO|nr:hypothetical protein PR202_ga14582 [Eleusine coracana subsp. coracana]